MHIFVWLIIFIGVIYFFNRCIYFTYVLDKSTTTPASCLVCCCCCCCCCCWESLKCFTKESSLSRPGVDPGPTTLVMCFLRCKTQEVQGASSSRPKWDQGPLTFVIFKHQTRVWGFAFSQVSWHQWSWVPCLYLWPSHQADWTQALVFLISRVKVRVMVSTLVSLCKTLDRNCFVLQVGC